MEGQPEGEIGLLLHYQNGWLSGEVSDDGPGIDPERLEAIFTKGYSTKVKTAALGCSLRVSRSRIWAEILPSSLNPRIYPIFCSDPPG